MAKKTITITEKILGLSQKYYGTRDLSSLSAHQLDKLTNWATNSNPNKEAHIKGNKFSGKTYGKLKNIF